MVEMELTRIIISETSDQQHIVLKEKGGVRELPIVIGIYEATAIDRGVKQIQTLRPLTHDLVRSVIGGFGARLERVVISDLRESTFYATLVIAQNGEVVEVDSRPSDAIAVAVQDGTPIFVEEKVLEEVCNWGVA